MAVAQHPGHCTTAPPFGARSSPACHSPSPRSPPLLPPLHLSNWIQNPGTRELCDMPSPLILCSYARCCRACPDSQRPGCSGSTYRANIEMSDLVIWMREGAETMPHPFLPFPPSTVNRGPSSPRKNYY